MLCSVQSNPSDYSIIRMNLDIPWKCDYVKYYISSINTKANFLSTTDDDYLLFEWEVAKDDEDDEIPEGGKDFIRIEFRDTYYYNLNYLVKYLNEAQKIITFENDNNRTIKLYTTSDVDIKFIEGTHRAKLITGFYNTTEFFLEQGDTKTVPDLPILDFANKLYLVSLQGQAIRSSIGDMQYTPSVIANIDTMIVDNEALIVNYDTAKPIKIKCNTDSLKYLEMRLVDFMYQPVILKSPLFITMKIKPARDANIYDVMTK